MESLRSETTETTREETYFACAAPGAEGVFLAGTFNDWDPTVTPMIRNSSGTWTLLLDLAPGAYEYKFVVDGQWCCESDGGKASEGVRNCVPNAFGTMNSTVTVESLALI